MGQKNRYSDRGVGEAATSVCQRLPGFLVIGAAKAGTYTLYEHLARHPNVFMSPNKEPHFFAFGSEPLDARGGRPVHAWVDSLRAYQSLFAGAPEAQMSGECSVSYLPWPGTAERIHRFNPEMRLIASLRDPVDRAYSSFNYAKGYGIEPLKSLEEGFRAEPGRIAANQSLLLRYRELGLYARQLERFYSVFPREQIKVILFEDLIERPAEIVRELYEFIGVDSTVKPDPDLHLNETRVPNESNPVYRFLAGENWARSAMRKVLPLTARQALRDRVRRQFSTKPARLGAGDRRRFVPLFREEIGRLEQLIQRDLSAWMG